MFVGISSALMLAFAFTYRTSMLSSLGSQWVHFASATLAVPMSKSVFDLYVWNYYASDSLRLYRSDQEEDTFTLLYFVCIIVGTGVFAGYFVRTVLFLPALHDLQIPNAAFRYEGMYYSLMLHAKFFAAGNASFHSRS